MDEKEIIKALAKELAKRDIDSLRREVSTMKFEEVYKKLKGYNLCEFSNTSIGDDFFDVNYKNITATIYRTKRGFCEVSDAADVWLSDISSPIDTIHNI